MKSLYPTYSIDSHCHLDSDLFPRWREVVDEAESKGVEKIVTVLSEPDNLDRFEKMTEDPRLYFVLGCHPHHAREYDQQLENRIKKWVRKYPEKVVGIGETGLDYHYHFSKPPVQRRVFKRHLQLARDLNLPVVIHTREAAEETLSILEETKSFQKLSLLFHCYTQAPEFLKHLFQYPHVHFSFSGIVTFKKAEYLRKQLRTISLANLQVETDAPYLAPAPYRGKENTPAYLPHTIKSMADTLSMNPEVLQEILTVNTLRFFRLEDERIPQEVAYEYKDNIYLNITSYCGLQCRFCIKKQGRFGGLPLYLKRNPSAEEVVRRLQEFPLYRYREVIFCGYGEATLNLPVLQEVSRWIKQNTSLKIRLNTNGLGNYFHQRNIVPDLAQCVDTMSISLNASSSEEYRRVMKLEPFQPDYYSHIEAFLREARKNFSSQNLTVSAVRLPSLDIEAFREKAAREQVAARLRP